MSAGMLVEVAAKATIVLLTAFVVTHLLRTRSSAATRHVVWASAIIGVLFLPIAVAFGPVWHMRVLEGWIPAPAQVETRLAPTNASPQPTRASQPGVPAARRSEAALIDADRLFSAPQMPDPSQPARWPLLIVLVWLAGVTFGILRLGAGLAWAAWLARHATRIADAEWSTAAAHAAAALRMTTTVPLHLSDRTTIPATCGVVRPVILLPTDSVNWSRERRHAVLLHEHAHVKRGDCLVHALVQLTSAVHWFNPLAWAAGRRLRAEAEQACDDLVLGAGVTRISYAGHLYAIAQRSRARAFPGWATLAMAQSSRLAVRMRTILDATCNRRPLSHRIAIAVTTVAGAAIVLLGSVDVSTMAPSSAATAATPAKDGPIAAYVLTRSPGIALIEPTVPERLADAAITPGQTGELRAFLSEHCVSCHNSTRRVANVALDALSVDDVGQAPHTWEKVVRKLRSGLHPPKGRPRLDPVTATSMITTLEAALDQADQANWDPGVAEPFSQTDLARRLATFLWSADPDPELMDLATRGRLSDLMVLGEQARRMLADPRSSAWRRGFFGQWLYLGNVDRIKPDAVLFPEFDDSLREAFRRETELFLDSQVHDDRSVTELLTANYTFINERLARHYGVPNISGPEFRRVTLRDEARGGLLGQGSILTVTSYANRTSPVLRGKFVLDTFLGAPPPPPPPNVPALKNSAPDNALPLRRRMEESVKAPVCASCHSLIDPIGFALENFDAIGQWRDTDAGVPIDASGTLSDDTPFEGPVGFRVALLQRSDQLVLTIAERLLAYALSGQTASATSANMPAVRAVVADTSSDNHRWTSLVVGIVRSTPFRMRKLAP